MDKKRYHDHGYYGEVDNDNNDIFAVVNNVFRSGLLDGLGYSLMCCEGRQLYVTQELPSFVSTKINMDT